MVSAICLQALLTSLWMNEWKFIYSAFKTPTQNLACSQCQIPTVHTCKLSQAETTKGHSYNQSTDSPNLPTPSQKVQLYNVVGIYAEFNDNVTKITHTHKGNYGNFNFTQYTHQWSHRLSCLSKEMGFQRRSGGLNRVLLLDAFGGGHSRGREQHTWRLAGHTALSWKPFAMPGTSTVCYNMIAMTFPHEYDRGQLCKSVTKTLVMDEPSIPSLRLSCCLFSSSCHQSSVRSVQGSLDIALSDRVLAIPRMDSIRYDFPLRFEYVCGWVIGKRNM